MTDKQQAWNAALEIVLDKFRDFAWQKGLDNERERAAAGMGNRVKHKCREKSGDDYQQTMFAVVTPFCKMLKCKSQPEPPFNIALPEAEKQGRNDALEIVLEKFRDFAGRDGLALDQTCSEIAEDMIKRVDYDARVMLPASWGDDKKTYRQAMDDVVNPFYKELKNEPQREC